MYEYRELVGLISLLCACVPGPGYTNHRAGGRGGNSLDSYSVGAGFESQMEHQESLLSFLLKLNTHLHLVLRSRVVELYLHSPTSLQCIVLYKVSTGTNLPFHFYKL
jgi:hypothetical protein